MKSAVAVRLALLLVAAGFAHPGLAMPLFRADTRPPAIVFAEGFTAPGLNTNPLLHLTGAPCLGAHGAAEWTTAYVSMTEDIANVVGFATYVYRITPDEAAIGETATHDVRRGLRALSSQWRQYDLTVRDMDLITNLQTQPSTRGQHLARRVAPESILYADVYQYDPVANGPRWVRREGNPRYRAPARSGSSPVFSAGMIHGIRTGGHPSQMHVVVARGGNQTGLCLVPSGACFERAPQRLAPGPLALFPTTATCATTTLITPGSAFQQALQLLLRD